MWLSTVTVQVVYIDGSHLPQDVLTDAVMAWKLLKNEGIMIFDGWYLTAHERWTHKQKWTRKSS